MPRFIRFIILYLGWLLMHKPVIHYEGYHCGCCGRWHDIPFDVPEYKTCGEWWDTWGMCPDGDGCMEGMNYVGRNC